MPLPRAASSASALLAVAFLVLPACTGAGEPPGEGPTEETPAADDPIEDPVPDVDAGPPDVDPEPAVTWYRDVLPVAQAKCMSCHRGGGIGTFSMEDPETARSLSASMAIAVDTGAMPPWPPNPDCAELADARTITADEKQLFIDWANAGAPLGDEAHAPPSLEEEPGLVAPDVDLTVPAYVPNFEARTDDYRCLVVDPELSQNEHVVAMEFAPDRGEMVHHIIVFRANRGAATTRDAQDEGPGWECFGGADVGQSDGVADTLGAWAPGVRVVRYPAGTGIELKHNEVVVLQIHYNADNLWQPEPPADETGLKLRFADGDVSSATLLPAPLDDFEIPAGAVGHSDTLEVSLPSFLPGSIPVYGLMPHMHELGRRITVTSSTVGCLVDIPDWDFAWQQAYFFEDAPLDIPLSSSLSLTCEWDNPTDEPVTWGEGTADEMCLVYVYTVLPGGL